jgi:hypothetical protein
LQLSGILHGTAATTWLLSARTIAGIVRARFLRGTYPYDCSTKRFCDIALVQNMNERRRGVTGGEMKGPTKKGLDILGYSLDELLFITVI